MNVRFLIVTLTLLAYSPCHGQVKSAVRAGSLYSDSVLKMLVRSSQLAADRQRSLLRRSALEANETSGIRRSSTMTPTDLQHLDRLSTFAGDKMRRLEELSEFRNDEISRMQAEFKPRESRPSEVNQFAELADKNSTMARLQILQLLKASDDRDWARQVRKSALATAEFSTLLKRLSLSSAARKSEMERLSLGK
jgi:hypothetical protein